MNIACKFEEGKAQIYCNFNQVWYGPMFQKKKKKHAGQSSVGKFW